MTATGTAFAEHRTREFGWTGRRAYLNAASFGPLPGRSKDAIDGFNRRRWQAVAVDADLTAPLTAARVAAARLINAEPDSIALVPNTSVGINLAAMATLQVSESRRVILVSDREFPANVYPWLALERSGFVPELMPVDERGFPDEEALIARIAQGDVATVSVSFVQFSTGYRADLRAIGAACREQGTLFVVDAIQGLGAVPLDVESAQIDLLACGGQKWLCAPWGSGFTYVRPALIAQFEPLFPGWLSFEATQDFNRLTQYDYDLLDDARRFETGSLGFQDILGMQHAIELLLELNVSEVWRHIQALQQPIIEWAQSQDVEIVSTMEPERRSGILCIRPANPERAFQALTAADVRCAMRENSIRISPHWYNTMDDIERALEVLRQ